MTELKDGVRTKHLNGFAPAPGSKLPFSADLLTPEAKAREELLGAQRAFLAKTKRSAKDVMLLTDHMVAFEKVRSGHNWRDSDADSVARTVASVVGRDGASVDFSAFEPRRPKTMSRLVRLDVPEFDLNPFNLDGGDERGKGEIIDLSKVNCGTYFDKWFDYSGSWTLTTLGDHARTAPPFAMNFVQAHNLNPHGKEAMRATSEAGIWFTYVPDADGYVTLIWSCENATLRNYREYFGKGDTFGLTNVEAVAGIWADEFAGREYLKLGEWSINPIDERKVFSPLIVSNSTYPVRAGQPVNVMVGARSKLLAEATDAGLNAGVGMLSPFTTIMALTRYQIEPYNPFIW